MFFPNLKHTASETELLPASKCQKKVISHSVMRCPLWGYHKLLRCISQYRYFIEIRQNKITDLQRILKEMTAVMS
jgi:hypothetical protein